MKKYQTNKTYPEVWNIFLFLVLVILPSVIWVHSFKDIMFQFPWYSEKESTDIFLYGKAVLLCLCGVGMAVSLIWHWRKEKQKEKLPQYSLFLFIYLFFVIASTIASGFPRGSIYGITDHFESVWVLLSYGIVCLFSYFIVKKGNGKETFFKFLFWGIVPVLVVTISQLFHIDIYRWMLQQYELSFLFENGRVFGPFYNPNYVGSYAALLLPVVLFCGLAAGKKHIRIFTLLGAGLILTLLGSKSATGFFALVISAVLAVILYFRKQNGKKLLIAAVIFLAVVGGISVKGGYLTKIQNTLKEDATPKLEKITTNDEDVQITYNGVTLSIKFQMDVENAGSYRFSILTLEGENVPYTVSADGTTIILTDESLQGMLLYPFYMEEVESGLLTFIVDIDGTPWAFTNQTDGSYYYVTTAGKLDKMESSPSLFFENHGSFASGRGYLWSKTFPLLKKHFIFGSGPDTFGAVYPNGDYVDKYNNGYHNMYVSKPHNMYLQIGVQTGVLSLLAFLLLYGFYFVESLRCYWNSSGKAQHLVGIGIFLGTFGYMISGIFNDSTVTVAPLFWCLLGAGIAVNQLCKEIER